MTISDSKIFEAPYVCSECDKVPANNPEHPTPLECSCENEPATRRRRYVDVWLAGAEKVADIHCMRVGDEALVDIPQLFVYHSPDGFEWGYGGSGPSDLALNVLALFIPTPEAWRLHHFYKDDVIARLPNAGATIDPESVRYWIQKRWTTDRLADKAQAEADRLRREASS